MVLTVSRCLQINGWYCITLFTPLSLQLTHYTGIASLFKTPHQQAMTLRATMFQYDAEKYNNSDMCNS